MLITSKQSLPHQTHYSLEYSKEIQLVMLQRKYKAQPDPS